MGMEVTYGYGVVGKVGCHVFEQNVLECDKKTMVGTE